MRAVEVGMGERAPKVMTWRGDHEIAGADETEIVVFV
jgi:hypothetical protein